MFNIDGKENFKYFCVSKKNYFLGSFIFLVKRSHSPLNYIKNDYYEWRDELDMLNN